MVTFKETDLVFYKSGVTGNNLGGAVYTADGQLSETIHGLFNTVSKTERTLGKTKYRCIYMKNTSVLKCRNPKLFIPQNTPSSGTELFVGFDPHGVGNGTSSGVADPIPDESTAPTGVQFTNATEVTSGIALGKDIPKDSMVAIWLMLRVNFNTEKADLDGTDVFIQVSNEKDFEETITPPVDTNTGVVGETDANEWFAKLLERLRLRGFDWLTFTGNISSNTSDPKPWFNMLGGLLRDRTAISFGPFDAINPQMKNSISTILGNTLPSITRGYYFKKRYNLYEIFMDVTQPFENPSPQYDFIKSKLAEANNDSKVDFIVVYCNKAFYATLAANDASQQIDGRLRTTYHKLFEDNNVHVVISGQFRNYQRSKVLSWNEAAPDSPGEYTTGEPNYTITGGNKGFGEGIGCLFIINGLGGKRPIHSFAADKSYISFKYSPTNEYNIGYIMMKSQPRRVNPTTNDIINNAKLTISFYEYNMPTFIQSIFGKTPQEILKDQVTITLTEE